MLGDFPIEVVLLATDLQASRNFYVQKIGLEIVRETDYAVWFKCGREGALSISSSTSGTTDEQDQATWRMDDVAFPWRRDPEVRPAGNKNRGWNRGCRSRMSRGSLIPARARSRSFKYK